MFDDFLFNDEPKNSPHVMTLFNAASRNQLEKLNSIFVSYPSVNVQENVNGLNCIHIASKKGHLEIVRRIHHCYPEIVSSRTSDNKRSSLMLAAFEGHESVVDYLSEFELETAVDIQGNNALHYACWGGRLQIVKTLIEIRHFDPLLRNSEGLSAIQFATAGKHVDLVQYLAHRCSRNLASESSDSGYNSLHRAAIYNSLTTIKLLLLSMSETGEDSSDLKTCVESKAFNGNTVLHLAAQHGGKDIVEYLVEMHNIDLNMLNDYDLTPLHFACIGGHTDIVRYMIRNGANVHLRNSSGSTALHLAATGGHHLICGMLSEQPDIELLSLDSEGHSPIDVAINAGYKDLAANISLWSCMTMRTQELFLLMKKQ